MRRKLMTEVLAVLVGVFLIAAGTTLAQDKKPDATLTFSGGHVSAGIGYSWGSGTLTYKGKKHPFSVDGLAVGAVGGSSISASGDVYDLKKLEDFNGNYTAGTAGATIGGGAGGTAMQNDKGVVIKLVSTTQGIDFKLAASGVKIKLKK